MISEIEGRPVQVAGSGRTDAGVHALAQVAAFSIENPIPLENLRRAMNRLLPRDIRVLSVEEAALDFHPRFQAKRRPTNIASFAARSVRRSNGVMCIIILIRWRCEEMIAAGAAAGRRARFLGVRGIGRSR